MYENGFPMTSQFRNFSALTSEEFNEEQHSTATSREQLHTERIVKKCYLRFEQLYCMDQKIAQIHRDEHITFLQSYVRVLPSAYECLDSSRPWLLYWILNSAHNLNYKFSGDLLDNCVDFLIKCRNPTGGFGGGPGQLAHLAPTYAAVNALCIIGSQKAFDAIDKESLKQFLFAIREPNGAYRLHVNGEIDTRGAYCALSCATLVNYSQQEKDALFRGTAEWLASCQTYEGGFGGTPDLEAHGGYTFCGIAGLVMLGQSHLCDLDMLLKWSLNRQMRFEGGFQGRTNKLVDGCYSFWVGATLTIAQAIIAKEEKFTSELIKSPLFCRSALQEYVLICCQRPNGGLLDKPGKSPDLYHTNYALSGLSIAQHFGDGLEPFVIGDENNELLPIHPIHNISPVAVLKTFMHFNSKIE